MTQHIYTELKDAEYDLELFSRMNLNEGRIAYLVFCTGGSRIQYTAPTDESTIHMLSLNGKLFIPK